MVPPVPVILLIAGFVSSLVILAGMLRLAERLNVVAMPNERSSHTERRPTAGGVAIALPALAVLAMAAVHGDTRAVGLLVSGGVLAMVGLLDDLRDLSAAPKFTVQVLAVALLLWSLPLDVHWLVWMLIAFLVLWHVNLFNFMDGIDGIAGVQALIFCVGVQVISGGVDGLAGNLIWVITGSTLGFLTFNWPPARIFMGDVGALFLGLMIAALVVVLHVQGLLSYVPAVILLTGFWFDASFTLCVRMMTGQPFTRPHRSHLYQRLTDRLGHRRTTLLFALMGLGWLLPLAWLSSRHEHWGLILVAAAVLPYLAGAVAFKAGFIRHGPA